MPTFVIHGYSRVEKWYTIEAEDEDAAREKATQEWTEEHTVDNEDYGCDIEVLGPASDFCPKCLAVLEMSLWNDGKFYIYCPHCGPIPEIAEVTEIDDTHLLAYPPEWVKNL